MGQCVGVCGLVYTYIGPGTCTSVLVHVHLPWYTHICHGTHMVEGIQFMDLYFDVSIFFCRRERT